MPELCNLEGGSPKCVCFRGLSEGHSKTYSELAFRLSTQLRRWLESEDAFAACGASSITFTAREFQSKLNAELRFMADRSKNPNII